MAPSESFELPYFDDQLQFFAMYHEYSFGSRFGGASLVTGLANRFLYNGKELQDELGLNWYDYGARMYSPSLGRWNGVDALAERYQSWSPYNYTLNNPLRYIDPDGNSVQDPPSLKKIVETGLKHSARFQSLMTQNSLTSENYEDVVSVGGGTGVDPKTGNITLLMKGDLYDGVASFAMELSNRKKLDTFEEYIKKVETGEIKPEEYAEKVLKTEAESYVDKVMVIYELVAALGIDVKSIRLDINRLVTEKITEEELLKERKDNYKELRVADTGENSYEYYIAQGKRYRDLYLKKQAEENEQDKQNSNDSTKKND